MTDHAPICGTCLTPWPCEHSVIERNIRRLNWHMERMCPACRQTVENGQYMGKVDDRWYHTAKSRAACRRAFITAGGRP